MRRIKLIGLSVLHVLAFIFLLLTPVLCRAMPPGTLLYRTTTDGKMYGYSDDPLMESEKGIIRGINPGHTAIYIGQENGEDYVVEALASGVVKMPAKYFLNSAEGEKFLGAKIPAEATAMQRAKAIALAKNLAASGLDYDFDFQKQKGSGNGEWTCVGVTEKLYESADISNPHNLNALEYDPSYYAVDITPDGFDNYSVVNADGDCFSRDREFSRIARKKDLLLPAPELIGFNAGLEYQDERYIFLPYTQFLQPTLENVAVDIDLESSFSGETVRGRAKVSAVVLRWSLINNPISSLKKIAGGIKEATVKAASKTKELAQNLSQKIFGSGAGTEIVLGGDELKKTASKTSGKTAASKTTAKSAEKDTKSSVKITVNKATGKSGANGTGGTGGANGTSGISGTKAAGGTSETNKVNGTNGTKIISGANGAAKTNSGAATSTKINKSAAVQKNTQAVTEKTTVAKTVNTVNDVEQAAVNIASAGNMASGTSGGNNTAQEMMVWPEILINRIYSTGDNDFVELYNPTESDFDLAAAGYRLERAKSAEDPSLVMRIGDAADGTYPGGTIIKAHGYYLIVRDDASDYYRSRTDAIATRDEFSWTGSGYTLYLGLAAISSSADPDLADAVGFGPDATYFQGSSPAPEITDNYILSRVGVESDNAKDFNLILSDDPAVLAVLATENNIAASINIIATSTEEAAASTDSVATSTAEVMTPTATSTEELIAPETESAVSTEEVKDGGLAEDNTEPEEPEESDEEEVTEEPIEPEEPIDTTPIFLATINKIYSTDDNDWIELYNPTESDFDLAAAGYRLEKAKTAEDPSLVMRLGNTEDGTYPGGTIIKAHGFYLIVRDDASEYYRSRADAIATRDEFSWTGSGYTLYLAQDAVSSSTDADIIEAVGFGSDATYFQGNGPAPAITANYFLNRVAINNDNASDFNLMPADDPEAVAARLGAANIEDDNDQDSNNNDDDDGDVVEVDGADLFVPLTPIISGGLTDLWHFEECYGSGKWVVGRWDCARETGYVYDEFLATLKVPRDLSDFSVGFYYKKSLNNPKLDLHFKEADGTDGFHLVVQSGIIKVEGLPESKGRYYLDVPFDEDWHQAVLTVNQVENYWAVYLDGEEVIKTAFNSILPTVNSLEVGGDGGSVLLDELAVWNRALTLVEISSNYVAAAPFSPMPIRDSQLAAELVNFWDFSEKEGLLALDDIDGVELNLAPDAWIARSHENYAISTSFGKTFTAALNTPLVSQDLSLAFWYRNDSYPNEGRANVYLTGGAGGTDNLFVLLANYFRQGFWFNGTYGIISQGVDNVVPHDDAWHHLTLVYDSYRYKLTLYVDGEEAAAQSLIWMPEDTEIDSLKITTDGHSASIDDLAIWRGALSTRQVEEIYDLR